MSRKAWPALPYEAWMPTKKTLHICSQMIGKARLALAPPQPEWLNACLYLTPSGLTTGSMPHGTDIVSMGIDVYRSAIRVRVSDGRDATIPLGAGRCVADIWSDFRKALIDLGLTVDIWEKPQEVPDITPFAENEHDCTIVAGDAQRFLRAPCFDQLCLRRVPVRASSAAAAHSSGGAPSTSRCCCLREDV